MENVQKPMKTLKDYLSESETWMHTPAEGDAFGIELSDGTLIESYIFELADDSILLDATPDIMRVLESWNLLSEQESEDGVLLEMGYGTLGEEDVDEGIFDRFKKKTKKESYSKQDFYQWLDKVQEQIASGEDIDEVIYNLESSLEKIYTDDVVAQFKSQIWDSLDLEIDEAKYHGREVPLGKPMKGDVKKSKVYVRDPATGNIKKVNFGDPNMRIKKTSPAHRKSFRARHHCENPGSRLKARYWSCRAW
jgi:hypothetical protein